MVVSTLCLGCRGELDGLPFPKGIHHCYGGADRMPDGVLGGFRCSCACRDWPRPDNGEQRRPGARSLQTRRSTAVPNDLRLAHGDALRISPGDGLWSACEQSRRAPRPTEWRTSSPRDGLGLTRALTAAALVERAGV